MDLKARIAKKRKDKGFTLIELLIVIAILGILSTIVVLSVRGITDRGQSSACSTDKNSLASAYEAAIANGLDLTATPATDVSSTLVANGYLRSVSQYYKVDSNGTVAVKTGVTKCT